MANDPKRILDTANSFLIAADRALEERPIGLGQVQMLLVPAVVSAAFAIELYFKAIITLEKGNARGHDLSNLFQQMSKPSQASIVSSMATDFAHFESDLVAISHAFIEWRYIFEQQSASMNLAFLRRLTSESKKVADALATLLGVS